MRRAIRLLVGGRSTEHDASLLSYAGVLHDLQRRTDLGLSVSAVYYISRTGRISAQRTPPWPVRERELSTGVPLTIGSLVDELARGDGFIFNLLHGNEGEDGGWQGLAEIANLRGSFGSVFAASLTMNKWAQSVIATTVLSPLLQMPRTWRLHQFSSAADLQRLLTELEGRPCVIKPNRMGASLLAGVYHGLTMETLSVALDAITPYDSEVLVQEYISGNEFTCGCVEINDHVVALPVIEAITPNGFLGHQEKHRKGMVQARLITEDTPITTGLQEISCRLFRVFDLLGMARFDFIVSDQGVPYYLETNSIPGLMPGSAYPKMLRQAGLDCADLVNLCIQAVDRRSRREKVLPYVIEDCVENART